MTTISSQQSFPSSLETQALNQTWSSQNLSAPVVLTNNQPAAVLGSSPVLGTTTTGAWQQDQMAKGVVDDSLQKRDFVYHQVRLPDMEAAQSVPHTRAQLLPVGMQGFQQGEGLPLAAQPAPLMQTGPVLQQQAQVVNQGAQFVQQSGVAQSGTIALKPICIEQEPVSFRPGPITIEQPPVMVQPEAITIPQPPIVIHPEPIVIPQAPLVFQPPAVSLPRQALTYNPDVITLSRPSYSVQPLIQYDVRANATFADAELRQSVHIRLTNEELMRQQNLGGTWSSSQQPMLQSGLMQNQATSPAVGEKARFFSRDRDYNYGNAPSTTDKFKNTMHLSNVPNAPKIESTNPSY